MLGYYTQAVIQDGNYPAIHLHFDPILKTLTIDWLRVCEEKTLFSRFPHLSQ
jgi:hypothetical protein